MSDVRLVVDVQSERHEGPEVFERVGHLDLPFFGDQPGVLYERARAVELLRDGKLIQTARYALNTWTDVVDVDVSRAYNLPSENPVTVSNLPGLWRPTRDKSTAWR